MADDIVTFGGPERGSKRDAAETIESLFHAQYPGLVRAEFLSVGDWDLAEQLVQEAYLRMWRRWRTRWRTRCRTIPDSQAAPFYLRDAITQLSRAGGSGAWPTKTAPEANGPEASGPDANGGAIDTERAWLSLQEVRSRSSTNRRRAVTAMAAAVAVAAIAVPILAGSQPGNRAPRRPAASTGVPGSPRTYPRAIVARIPVSGVMDVVGNSTQAWAVRAVGQPGTITSYQLVGMNLPRKASLLDADQDVGFGAAIMYRVNLGREPRAISAGAGRVWLTTPYSQAGGQIVRVNPATGQILSTIHIPAGPCTAISFSSAHLFASCNVGGVRRNAIWRINPVTQQVFRLTGTLHGYISSLTAAPRGLWYVMNFRRIARLTNTGGNPQPVTARDPGYQYPPPGGQGLVYDSGSIWALSGGERLTQIDAFNGRVTQVFTYRNYDPGRAGGLNFLAAGGGWLWFLDNGYPFSGVLRIGETTGRPAGGVAIAPNSCGQQVCSQVFYTPGSVWVPTAELLLRIDTSRLPASRASALGDRARW